MALHCGEYHESNRYKCVREAGHEGDHADAYVRWPSPAPDAFAPTSELVAHHRAETDAQLAEGERDCRHGARNCDMCEWRQGRPKEYWLAASVRHPDARPRVVEPCACAESDMYRELLERAADRLTVLMSYGLISGALLTDINVALALRGSR